MLIRIVCFRVRTELAKPPEPIFPRPSYIVPETEKQKRAKLDRRLKAEKDRNFCKWDDLQLPRPIDAAVVGRVVSKYANVVKIAFTKVLFFAR